MATGLSVVRKLFCAWQSTGKWPDFCSDPDLRYDCKAQAAKLRDS